MFYIGQLVRIVVPDEPEYMHIGSIIDFGQMDCTVRLKEFGYYLIYLNYEVEAV